MTDGKSLAILAMGQSLRFYFQDLPAYATRFTDQVWAINNAGYWVHDIDMIVSMDDLLRDSTHWPDHVKNMAARNLPILTCAEYPQWPLAVAFPFERYQSEFGKPSERKTVWMDNSIAYALAMGLMDGYADIHLYGCDFAWTDNMTSAEQARRMGQYPESVPWWFIYHQRDTVRDRRSREPGVENVMYLIGRARERGVRVHIPHGSTLMDMDRAEHWYGMQTQPWEEAPK